MNGTDLPNELWHKSSHSNGQANCVEVAFVDARVAMRDSKDPSGSALLFAADEWEAFLAGVISGEFNRS